MVRIDRSSVFKQIEKWLDWSTSDQCEKNAISNTLIIPPCRERVSDDNKYKEEYHLKFTDIVEASDILIALKQMAAHSEGRKIHKHTSLSKQYF